MESFDKLTEIYIEDLKKTPTYKQYRDKLKALKIDDEMWEKVTEYKNKRFELQKNLNPDELYDQSDRLEREYAFLYDNPVSAGYLDAEVAICKLVQDTCLKITQAIELE